MCNCPSVITASITDPFFDVCAGGTLVIALNLTSFQNWTGTAPPTCSVNVDVSYDGDMGLSLSYSLEDSTTYTVVDDPLICGAMKVSFDLGGGTPDPNRFAIITGCFGPTVLTVFSIFSPPIVFHGGTIILRGVGFKGGPGNPGPDVTDIDFNGTPVIDFTIIDDTTIIATVPVGATTGPVTMSNGDASATSDQSVMILDDDTLGGPAILHYS